MIQNTVIFDGDCAFCNRSVLFILKKSKNNDIYCCSGQSEYGKKLIQEKKISADPAKTLIYVVKDDVFDKSNAVLKICTSLKGLYPVLIIFKIIPKTLRDVLYDFVSKRRKSIGKSNSCSFELASTFKDKILS